MSVSCKRRSTSSILIPCKATCRQREFGRRTAVFLRCGDGGKGRLGCIVLLRYVVGYSVLQRIGGFPTDALSEDYLITLKTKSVGFRTVSLNERLSLGLPRKVSRSM